MQNVKLEPFKVIGISVRTSNNNGEAARDIGQLWEKFMTQGISDKIPNKIDHSIFSIYTNYEGDHTQPYDTILGCKVSSLEDIPDGMVGQKFDGGPYAGFKAKGNLKEGVVYKAWTDIWEKDLSRKFSADFEVYGEKAQNPENAEVEILVALTK